MSKVLQPITTPASLLDISGLTVEFDTDSGTFTAVEGIELSIAAGECLTIIGESGSGKSVTASAIMGLIDTPPGHIRSGRILFEGQDLLTMPDKRRRTLYGRRISMIFQDPLAYLNPVYSIGWQVCEVMRIHGTPAAEARKKTIELLGRVGIPEPEERYGQFPHQFSGGQRQRIMIAIAMAGNPSLLIADEPTTALDVTVQTQILDLLRSIQRETGMGLLMITHDLDVAERISDRVAVMQRGRIVETGTVQDVFSKPSHPYTNQLINARAVGAPVERAPATEALLTVDGVCIEHQRPAGFFERKKRSSVKAVDNVSFTLHAGEIVGIIGESGCGKSSLARSILRLDQPTCGRILFEGQDIQQMKAPDLARYRRALQPVFQDPFSSLNTRMSVMDILAEPWDLNPGIVAPDQWRARAAQLLEQVGMMASDLDKYPGEFSGGQRQRIAIARALALEPRIVVCDEAVSALDMIIQRQVMVLLSSLRDQLGLAYIFITHDLHLVRDFADRVLVMRHGQIIEQNTASQIFNAPQTDYARKLLTGFGNELAIA